MRQKNVTPDYSNHCRTISVMIVSWQKVRQAGRKGRKGATPFLGSL